MIDLVKHPHRHTDRPPATLRVLRMELRDALEYIDNLEFVADYRRRNINPILTAWSEDNAEAIYYRLPEWIKRIVPPVHPESNEGDIPCESCVPCSSI